MSKEYMSQAAFAKYLTEKRKKKNLPAVSRQYINKLIRLGTLEGHGPKNQIKVIDAEQTLKEMSDPARKAKPEKATKVEKELPISSEEMSKNSFNNIRTERELWNAKQAELDYRKAAGELVEIDKVVAAGFEIGKLYREKLLGIIPSIKGELLRIDSEHELDMALRRYFNQLLSEVKEDASRRLSDVC